MMTPSATIAPPPMRRARSSTRGVSSPAPTTSSRNVGSAWCSASNGVQHGCDALVGAQAPDKQDNAAFRETHLRAEGFAARRRR